MKRLIFWMPPIIWMIFIFTLSERQRIAVAPTYAVNFVIFKSLHVIEYAILFFLFFRAFHSGHGYSSHIAIRLSFLLTIGYAVSDEIHQVSVPTREGTVRDVIIDAVGAILSWTIIQYLLPRVPKKLKNWVKTLRKR